MRTNSKQMLTGGGKIAYRNLLLAFFSLALITSACTDETDTFASKGTSLQLNVKTASIESRGLIESATLPDASTIGLALTDEGGTTYDKISYKNIKATASTGVSPQTWTLANDMLLSSTSGTLYGYYPYNSAVTDITQIPVTAGDTDYMYATPVTDLNDGNNSATLVMNHALAAIRLKIVRGTYTGTGAVTSVSVSGENIASSGTLNARTGALSSQTGAGTTITYNNAFTLSTTAKQIDQIIVPVSDTSAKPTFTINMDDAEYTVTPSSVTFEQGSIYEYTLTVDSKGISLSDVKVGDWSYNNSGNPVIEAGYKITLAGNTDGIAFSNKVNDDGSVTIVAMSSVTDYEVNAVTVAGTASYTSQMAADGTRTVTINSGFTQDVTVTFNGVKPKIKVYAVNRNGYLIDYNEGDNSCTGVAIVAGEHKFMIAKSDGSNSTLYWEQSCTDLSLTNYTKSDGTNSDGYLPKPDGTFGGSTHLSDDFTTWTAGALSDFNGKANTTVIAEASSGGMCSALNTFNASDSYKDWYVPACGQLALMYLNMTEINAALAKIGGTALTTGGYWSSSEHSSDYAWCVGFNNGLVCEFLKDNRWTRFWVRFVRDYTEPVKGTIDLTTTENGVYAVAKNSKGVSVDDANTSCIGVALITDNQRIMIPKENATDGTKDYFYWGYNLKGKDVSSILNIADVTEAKVDFNGKANTDAIITAYTEHNVSIDEDDMSSILLGFSANGYTDWYIPSAGQLWEIYSNIVKINTVLQKIGGTALTEFYYYSSSEMDAEKAWSVNFDNGVISGEFKYMDDNVRFVRDIKDMIYFRIIDGTFLQLTLQAEKGMTWKEWANSKYNTIGKLSLGKNNVSFDASLFGNSAGSTYTINYKFKFVGEDEPIFQADYSLYFEK